MAELNLIVSTACGWINQYIKIDQLEKIYSLPESVRFTSTSILSSPIDDDCIQVLPVMKILALQLHLRQLRSIDNFNLSFLMTAR